MCANSHHQWDGPTASEIPDFLVCRCAKCGRAVLVRSGAEAALPLGPCGNAGGNPPSADHRLSAGLFESRTQADFPSLLEQAWNVAKSLADFVADGFVTVGAQEYQRRLEILPRHGSCLIAG